MEPIFETTQRDTKGIVSTYVCLYVAIRQYLGIRGDYIQKEYNNISRRNNFISSSFIK